jgi:hypothetical protein
LTSVKLRGLKPKEKQYQVFDGGGLYLEVSPNGSKLWRIQKRVNGKTHRISLGKYPAIDLKTAREKRAALEANLAKKVLTPSAITTFGDLFDE